MGGVVSAGEAIGLYQGWHYGRRDQAWSKLGYDIAKQDMRINLLTTVREEIRDQITVVITSLDNMMVVATLMLSIGFAFAAEMAAPPAITHKDTWPEYIGHGIYTIFSALSLVLPFWCLIFTLRLRYEVDRATRDHVSELQSQLGAILENRTIHHTSSDEYKKLIEQGDVEYHGGRGTGSRSPRGKKSKGMSKVSGVRRKILGAMTKSLGGQIDGRKEKRMRVEENRRVAEWTREDLLTSLHNYKFYYPLAQGLLWAGLFSVVITCSVLHGMHLREKYEDEHWMYIGYMGITGMSALLAVVYMGWMWLSGVVFSPSRLKRRKALLERGAIDQEKLDDPDDSSAEESEGGDSNESEPLMQEKKRGASSSSYGTNAPRAG